MRFEQKVAIITGGARGIGAVTAEFLAKEGAHIVLLDVKEQQLAATAAALQHQGAKVLYEVVDITSSEQIERAMRKVEQDYQKVDILVNCAGILQDNLLTNMTEAEWDQVLAVNLKGSYLLAQHVTPMMIKQQSGKIVFISSQAARGAKGRVNYAASKAGVQGITRTLALELGHEGIHVNAVAPGFIDTELSEISAHSAVKRGIDDFQQFKESFIAKNPIQRTGKPEDIAHAILFLASSEADYITGQTLYVTGAP